MEFSIDQQDDTKVIRVTGKIMGEPSEASLIEAIQGLTDQGHINIVMDLSEVTWINSRGIGMCISALVSLRNKGGDFRLAGACHVVSSLMEKCRINQIFKSFDSVDEAVASFH